MKKLPPGQRRAVDVSEGATVRSRYLEPGQMLPLVIEPGVEGVNLLNWAQANKQFIETQLLKSGAILFRGFALNSVDHFERLATAMGGELMKYQERSSPRSQVGDHVYTSTDYPAEQSIFPHNEHSYSRTIPLRLFFCCLVPARQGGETPIGDCRKIFHRIDPHIREQFARKKYMYVRNFGDGFGLPWQTAFQTTDRAKVETYCRANDIEFQWKEDDRLRTSQVRPAIARHPRTGEMVWFNHATFFHVSTLDPQIRNGLLAQFELEDLPNNTYYGDGSPIEPAVLDELRRAYRQEMVTFSWQPGDLIMLDNMLTSHSRNPFVGPRKILFAMGDIYKREDF
jgi:alpha-ketoglutarate-dependent taurine dioxygenase